VLLWLCDGGAHDPAAACRRGRAGWALFNPDPAR
jgi:hypothetical protein